jgi:hypothetical protein
MCAVPNGVAGVDENCLGRFVSQSQHPRYGLAKVSVSLDGEKIADGAVTDSKVRKQCIKR